jgi:hypothetical protein
MDWHNERRHTTRRDVDLLVEPKSGADATPRRATSLSIDGLRLDGALPAMAGEVVRMAVHVPDERRPLRVRAFVVEIGTKTRLRFLGLTTRNRVRIAEYLFG